mmetsp:Transcript_35753/g.40591  ORF Transcript_35753/g.40591 Transcript_35753/m.40591 type:complete len:85 (-) Transcript_35753:129-383(-)
MMIGDNDDETTTLTAITKYLLPIRVQYCSIHPVVFATVASILFVNDNVSNCNHCQQQLVRTIETTAQATAATSTVASEMEKEDD